MNTLVYGSNLFPHMRMHSSSPGADEGNSSVTVSRTCREDGRFKSVATATPRAPDVARRSRAETLMWLIAQALERSLSDVGLEDTRPPQLPDPSASN